MNKFFRIASYEYLKHVLKKRFIFALLSPFLIIGVSILVGWLSVKIGVDTSPVGYVDEAGFVNANSIPQTVEFDIPWIQFENEGDAKTALANEEITGYYIVPEDYYETGRIFSISPEPLDDEARREFRSMLYFNLLQQIPDQRTAELIDGTEFDIVIESGKATEADNQWINIILPFFSGILFIVVVNVSGGYLLQAVVEEKENRTMEIMVTSVSPTELMGGKIIGNLSVGLTQLLFWLIFPLIGVLIARNFIPILNDLTFGNQFFWLTIIILIPAFVMVAAFMAMVGATATEAKEAQQVAGLFTLPIVAPYWFVSIIMNKPNGALAVGLSLFPLSAPVTLPLRTVFTTVPSWQIALSMILLVLCAVGAVWLAGRAFRIGMLRYGKRLSLKEIFRKA